MKLEHSLRYFVLLIGSSQASIPWVNCKLARGLRRIVRINHSSQRMNSNR